MQRKESRLNPARVEVMIEVLRFYPDWPEQDKVEYSLYPTFRKNGNIYPENVLNKFAAFPKSGKAPASRLEARGPH